LQSNTVNMRPVILFTLLAILALSCKEKNTPDGPSDIRIKNLTDVTFEQVSVNTSGGTNDYDAIGPLLYSDYKRFDLAYPTAEISVTIGGEVYTTGVQNYNYQVVLGPGKFTYEVYIENAPLKKLAIERVIPEAPLDK